MKTTRLCLECGGGGKVLRREGTAMRKLAADKGQKTGDTRKSRPKGLKGDNLLLQCKPPEPYNYNSVYIHAVAPAVSAIRVVLVHNIVGI